MLFKGVILFFLSSAVIAAPSQGLSDASYLPSARLPAEKVAMMKRDQKYPPGYHHSNVTFGEGADAISVPVIEADPDILLDNDKGIHARSLAPRGACMSFVGRFSNCEINYCWRDGAGELHSEYITIEGSNGPSNPRAMYTSNYENLDFDEVLNDGYNGWFPTGHECSNSNTQIFTRHLWQGGVYTSAYVDRVRCDTCDFSNLRCYSNQLKNNLIAFSNGVNSQGRCT